MSDFSNDRLGFFVFFDHEFLSHSIRKFVMHCYDYQLLIGKFIQRFFWFVSV